MTAFTAYRYGQSMKDKMCNDGVPASASRAVYDHDSASIESCDVFDDGDDEVKSGLNRVTVAWFATIPTLTCPLLL